MERLVSRLSGCLASLTSRQRQLLTLRSGFELERAYDGAQAARILRVSPGRERQLEQAAVTTLQRASQHSSCARASRSLSAIVIAVTRAPFEIVQRMLGPGQSAGGSGPTGSQAAASQQRTPGRRHQPARAHGTGQPPEVTSAGSAATRAVISVPHQGGTEWLLVAVAVAALALAAAALLAIRRPQVESGSAVSLPAWRPRRLRLSALMGALAALPLLTGGARRRSRAQDGEAGGALLEAPAAELVEPAAAPAAPDDARLAEAAAAFALATRLERDHDLSGAQDAFRRADELGHPDAAFYLGGMVAERGDLDGAQALYRRADELGHPDGAFNLGVLLEHQNDWGGAEAAYRRSDERGSALAAFNLGVLLQNRGDSDGAEAAYRRADERGDAGGAYSLGIVLAEKGDLTGAERAFDRADSRGDAAAAFAMGGLLVEKGDLAGAEGAYRRADDRGHAAGAFNLGVLLEDGGDLAGAEAAFSRAQERGHGELAEMARSALLELRGGR